MSNITDRLKLIKSKLNDRNLAKVAHPAFVKATPIRSGNAKTKTDLHANQVSANYPYAGLLNEGLSKQAPKGMTEPTIEAIRAYIEKELDVKLK